MIWNADINHLKALHPERVFPNLSLYMMAINMSHHTPLNTASSQIIFFYSTDVAIIRQSLKPISQQHEINSHSSETKPMPQIRYPSFCKTPQILTQRNG
jgi:hypothetical protein